MNKNYLLLLIPFLLNACVEGQYPYGGNYGSSYDPYPTRDCHYYGNCGYGNDDRYDHERYERDRRRHEREEDRRAEERREEERRERDRWRNEHRNDWGYQNDQRRPAPTPVPPPPPKPQENVIRPSCPSGTQYDGRHCKIIDQKLRRPGGDGNINPCPKGMWVSGDRCVGK